MEKLKIIQTKTERYVLGIKLSDRRENMWIRNTTRVAGHLARRHDERSNSGDSGDQKIRGTEEDQMQIVGSQWARRVMDSDERRGLGEAYIQQWSTKNAGGGR